MNAPVNPLTLTIHDEAARLVTMRDYRMLDEGTGPRLDDIAALASRLCAVPVAFAGLVGARRTFVASAVGLTGTRAARLDGLCRNAVTECGIVEVPDASLDPRFCDHPLVVTGPHLRFFAAAPLLSPLGHAVGALCVAGVEPGRLTIEQHGALAILARLAVGQLELGLASVRDPLTGLYNRGRLDAILARELGHATRRRAPLSVIAVDIDNLRRVNEICGDRAGDAVLRAVSGVLACDTNPRHVACRLAGRRFVIVLPGMDANGAAARAEALRESVASLKLNISTGRGPRITVSAGIAASPQHGTSPDQLLAEAGRALSLARALGSNRVMVAPCELDFSAIALSPMPAVIGATTRSVPSPA